MYIRTPLSSSSLPFLSILPLLSHQQPSPLLEPSCNLTTPNTRLLIHYTLPVVTYPIINQHRIITTMRSNTIIIVLSALAATLTTAIPIGSGNGEDAYTGASG
jgi:hypothetical protein